MEKFIPYSKLSKKKKRELDSKRRGTWAISPVTRVPANPRAYNRSKARKWSDDSSPSVPLLYFPAAAKALRSGPRGKKASQTLSSIANYRLNLS